MAKQRVLVDTNVVIEAFRAKCWNAICGRYSIETVSSVVAEALAGDPTEPSYVVVDEAILRAGLKEIHQTTPLMIAKLGIEHKEAEGLDLGERDLLAWRLAQGAAFDGLIMISTSDKAAIRVVNTLLWLDSLVSLQNLATNSGITPHQADQMKDHFKMKWLDDLRSKAVFGILF